MVIMTALKSKIIPQFTKFLSSDADPHEIALGFAVGTFVEILPAFGVKTLISLAIAGTIRKINRAAMLAALAIWNSVFILPVYTASLRVGSKFTQGSACTEMIDPFSSGISCFMKGFLPGVLIVGAGISLAVYFLLRLFFILKAYQNT